MTGEAPPLYDGPMDNTMSLDSANHTHRPDMTRVVVAAVCLALAYIVGVYWMVVGETEAVWLVLPLCAVALCLGKRTATF